MFRTHREGRPIKCAAKCAAFWDTPTGYIWILSRDQASLSQHGGTLGAVTFGVVLMPRGVLLMGRPDEGLAGAVGGLRDPALLGRWVFLTVDIGVLAPRFCPWKPIVVKYCSERRR